ncbi:hypothetical protein C8R46DRAFT_1030683 [Mycena filopes]|nr:hypothetical protein C8R46DRAFT_1030683 [Mycena filopes]
MSVSDVASPGTPARSDAMQQPMLARKEGVSGRRDERARHANELMSLTRNLLDERLGRGEPGNSSAFGCDAAAYAGPQGGGFGSSGRTPTSSLKASLSRCKGWTGTKRNELTAMSTGKKTSLPTNGKPYTDIRPDMPMSLTGNLLDQSLGRVAPGNCSAQGGAEPILPKRCGPQRGTAESQHDVDNTTQAVSVHRVRSNERKREVGAKSHRRHARFIASLINGTPAGQSNGQEYCVRVPPAPWDSAGNRLHHRSEQRWQRWRASNLARGGYSTGSKCPLEPT